MSIKDQINVEPAQRYNDIEESVVSYEEKQVSLWRILAEAVTLAAVTHTTDMKKLGNHHFLSNQARINLNTALMDAGIEAHLNSV